MKQIISAFRYIHEKKIIHRDVKLENILLHYDDEENKKNFNLMKAQVKIIDFGFACKISKEGLQYSVLGSPINMDPLILKKLNSSHNPKFKKEKQLGYNEMADIWSIGTICYEMLIGSPAFDSQDMEELVKRVEDGSITDVLACHQVKAGDVFYLPAGRVHAICGGIMLAEVQQSSDVTYRIFDYNRPGMDGKPRELHTELAAKALDYHVEENYRTNYLNNSNKAIQIIDSPYFDVRVMEVSKPFHRDLRKYDSFIISMCIEGDCMIKVRSTGDEVLLKEGSSTLIPAAIADYDIIPLKNTTRILDAFIDNQNNSMAGTINRFLHFTNK